MELVTLVRIAIAFRCPAKVKCEGVSSIRLLKALQRASDALLGVGVIRRLTNTFASAFATAGVLEVSGGHYSLPPNQTPVAAPPAVGQDCFDLESTVSL